MRVGISLQNRPDRRVELGIHQDDILAVPESLKGHASTELHGSGDIHEDIDELAARNQHRILDSHGRRPLDRSVESLLRIRHDDILQA